MFWYKLVFKQIQPIHIGNGTYGVINETRIFIPGWTIWGALTKAYNIYHDKDLSENQELFKNISCFYPCFDENGKDEKILFPNFKNGIFHLGNYSENRFRAKFVDTRVSTAINSSTRSALDESLHELNVILPGAKADYYEKDKDFEKQIYWTGIVKLNNEKDLDFLNNDFEIYIGGDIRYGLGRMKLVKKMLIENNCPKDWMPNEKPLKNYCPIIIENHVNNEKIELKTELLAGKVELLVDIENSWEKAVLNVSLKNKNGFYYMPGSILKENSLQSKMSIEKGCYKKKNN